MMIIARSAVTLTFHCLQEWSHSLKKKTCWKKQMVYVSGCSKQYTTQTLLTTIGLFHKYVNDTSCPLVMGFFVWWLSHSVDVFYEIIACF